MEEYVNKVRKFNSDTEEGENDMLIPGSPDIEPDTKSRKFDDAMLDSMNEVDRKSRSLLLPSGGIIIRSHEWVGFQP